LANDALAMAARSRASSPKTILHSDHGSGFTSWSFTQSIKHHELLGSMGTIGDCFDNAPMESFWGSMQIELLNRKRSMTFVELATAMADYIENFYNPSRRHSSLDYLTPDEFEAIAFNNNQARTLAGVAQ
jgi:transposase InsO family protein